MHRGAADVMTHKVGTVMVAAPTATLTNCVSGPLPWSVGPPLPIMATLSTNTGAVSWALGCGQAAGYDPFTLTATTVTGETGSGTLNLPAPAASRPPAWGSWAE